MPRNVTGTSSILDHAHRICNLVGRFGTDNLVAEASPEFAAAVAALVVACVALKVVDDEPYVIDSHAPLGPEDPSS